MMDLLSRLEPPIMDILLQEPSRTLSAATQLKQAISSLEGSDGIATDFL